MRAVIQRVTRARVLVKGKPVAEIGRGLVALVGFEEGDDERVATRAAERLWRMRIFEDEAGKMNLCGLELGLEMLLVPNFTVAGSTKKGHRPSFGKALDPVRAEELFELLASEAARVGIRVQSGLFREHMHLELVNDGPVTLILEIRP